REGGGELAHVRLELVVRHHLGRETQRQRLLCGQRPRTQQQLLGPGRAHQAGQREGGPESQERAMPVNAMLKPADSDRIRRSAANAKEAPAPAATPLTAAINGLSIVVSSSTIGL